MGKVNVLYSHGLKEIAGKAEEVLDITTPASVRDLIDRLVERHGSSFAREIHLSSSELGQHSPFYLVFVDGHKIPVSKKDEPCHSGWNPRIISAIHQRRLI